MWWRRSAGTHSRGSDLVFGVLLTDTWTVSPGQSGTQQFAEDTCSRPPCRDFLSPTTQEGQGLGGSEWPLVVSQQGPTGAVFGGVWPNQFLVCLNETHTVSSFYSRHLLQHFPSGWIKGFRNHSTLLLCISISSQSKKIFREYRLCSKLCKTETDKIPCLEAHAVVREDINKHLLQGKS